MYPLIHCGSPRGASSPKAPTFGALIAMDGMYAGFAGAKECHEKITILRGVFNSENV